jgi:hypothetical protein
MTTANGTASAVGVNSWISKMIQTRLSEGNHKGPSTPGGCAPPVLARKEGDKVIFMATTFLPEIATPLPRSKAAQRGTLQR